MNAYAIFVVTEHLETLRREAAERRVTSGDRPSIGARVAARLAALGAAFLRSDVSADAIVPRLDGYPYRG